MVLRERGRLLLAALQEVPEHTKGRWHKVRRTTTEHREPHISRRYGPSYNVQELQHRPCSWTTSLFSRRVGPYLCQVGQRARKSRGVRRCALEQNLRTCSSLGVLPPQQCYGCSMRNSPTYYEKQMSCNMRCSPNIGKDTGKIKYW